MKVALLLFIASLILAEAKQRFPAKVTTLQIPPFYVILGSLFARTRALCAMVRYYTSVADVLRHTGCVNNEGII